MSSDQIKRNIRWVSIGLLAFLVFLAFAQWLGADRANQVNLGHVLASPLIKLSLGEMSWDAISWSECLSEGPIPSFHPFSLSFWSSFLVA